MAIISNPMGEVTAPLNRVETALHQLCSDLGTLDVLPAVDEGVSKTNARLERVEQELVLVRQVNQQMAATFEAIRTDLGEVVRLLADGVAARDGGQAIAPAPTVPLPAGD